METLAYSLLLAHLATLSPADQLQNICLSPYSLQSAFALVQEGAKGNTKKEIEKTLHTKNFVALPDAEVMNEEDVIFDQANSIWINAVNAPKIKSSFLKTNAKKYQAEVTTLPFDAAAEQEINDWCSQKTHGRIPHAIDQLNPGNVMELINAIYFKGYWVKDFNPRLTQKEDFYVTDDLTVQTSMMHQTTHFLYGEDELCQMVELPFRHSYRSEQDEFALQIILPHEGTTLLGLEQSLAKGNQLPELGVEKVRLALPKFELNYSADLIPTLNLMGMSLPFSGKANFSGISKAPLCISTVAQKTFFKVDETGAEAAAVTEVAMMLTSAMPRPEKIFTMTVDHPFLIRLVNNTQHTTLFVANINNPSL